MSLSDEQLLRHFRDKTRIAVPFFGNAQAELFFTDEAELLEFADAIRSFLNLTQNDRDAAAPHVFAFFQDTVDETGFESVEAGMQGLGENSPELWSFVRPTILSGQISWELGDQEQLGRYIVVEGECGWEAEHGILMSWRDGRELVKVSGYDGHATNGHAYDDLELDKRVYHSFRSKWCTRNPLLGIN